jgi:hypothetical protein
VWAYQAFDHLTATYWAGRLPTPLILWLITPYGKCLGDTAPCTPSLIRLHPQLRARGYGFAYEVLLHECIHHAIHSGLVAAPSRGSSSHNNPAWVSEVNRLAPLLGLDIVAGRSTHQRVPIEGAPPTKRGKQPTRVERVTTGTVPYKAVATFPYGVRQHLGLLDWYAQHRRHTPAGPPPQWDGALSTSS